MKIVVYTVYGISQVLYKLFGYNTKVRKTWLADEANKLQLVLNSEHCIKDMVNRRTNGVYTTKKAIKIAKYNSWI